MSDIFVVLRQLKRSNCTDRTDNSGHQDKGPMRCNHFAVDLHVTKDQIVLSTESALNVLKSDRQLLYRFVSDGFFLRKIWVTDLYSRGVIHLYHVRVVPVTRSCEYVSKHSFPSSNLNGTKLPTVN